MSVIAVRTDAVSASSATYFPAFDFLRFALALAVLMSHAGLLPWAEGGDFSVQVFFALSGWLIGGILLRSDRTDIPHFYYNRATRIWIPYFLAILLLMVASLLKPIPQKWAEIFFYDWTFVYNLFGPPMLAQHVNDMPLNGTGNHFWSICAEEQFYLLAPLLIVVLPLGRSMVLWVALAIASTLAGNFTAITLGVLAAISVSRFGSWHNRMRPHIGAFAIIGIAAMIKNIAPYHYAAPIVAVCIVLALSYGANSPSRLGMILGGISYPLYLNQWVGLFAANSIGKLIGRDIAILGVAMSLATATILYFAVDAQIKRYRGAYYTKSGGNLLAAAAACLVVAGIAGHFWLEN